MNPQPATYTTFHSRSTGAPVKIDVETQRNDSTPEGYPVIRVGTVTLFLTMDQVADLADRLNAYLADTSQLPVTDRTRFAGRALATAARQTA